MTDYIKRDDAIDAIGEAVADGLPKGWRIPIEEIPSADVAPVRHAHWVLLAPIYNRDGLPTFPVKCSRKECGKIAWARTDYCPNCGAKMDLNE